MFEHRDRFLVLQSSGEIPVGVEARSIDLAEVQVVAEADQGLGRQHVASGQRHGVGTVRPSGQGRVVVVLRVQTMLFCALEHLQQLLQARLLQPDGLEVPACVEAWQQRGCSDLLAADRPVAAIQYGLAEIADLLRRGFQGMGRH